MHFQKEILLLFMGIVCICTCTANDAASSSRRSTQSRINRSSPNYGVMIAQLNGTISEMFNLQKEQRTNLDTITKELDQHDVTTMEHLENILEEQKKTAMRVNEIYKTQLDLLPSVENIRRSIGDNDMSQMMSHVHVRQATLPNADEEASSTADKLVALAVFSTSIQQSIKNLENTVKQLSAGLTTLTQVSRGSLNTLKVLTSRQQSPYSNIPNIYQQPTFHTEPQSCAHALLPSSGIEKIKITPQSEPFYAYCESGEKGGWTVILNRFDGSINFHRDWNEYKQGFGNLAGEFFIGLEKLNAMTSASLHELMIVLVDFQNETRYAHYNSFAIGNEKEYYPLQILGQYKGTAGDSLSHQAGSKFSTYDNDNDGWVEGNCAQAHTGAWWYSACETSNLNGRYLLGQVDESQQYQGMYWADFHGPLYSLKAVQMQIRPIEARPYSN